MAINHIKPRAPQIKKTLTPEQIKYLRFLSGIRLPMDHIAALFEMSKDTLEHLAKKDAAVRSAIIEGRAKFSTKIRKRLAEMAEAGDFQALKFWCQTQEGFKIEERLEVTGKDGGPVQTVALSRKDRLREIEKLRKAREELGDD
jgi:hypothetical protein